MESKRTKKRGQDSRATKGRFEGMREFWIKVYVPEFIYWIAVRPVLVYRKIRYGFAFRKITLSQGKFAMVDEKDYRELCQYKWYATNQRGHFYAARNDPSTPRLRRAGLSTPRLPPIRDARGGRAGATKKRGRHLVWTMHREILKCPKEMVIDHINHNGLDNRRVNLRMVTAQQNSWNVKKPRGKFSSKYKGVSFDKRSKKWTAAIFYKGKRIYIGQFDDEETAGRAYDLKAKELFKEYACLNFKETLEPRLKTQEKNVERV